MLFYIYLYAIITLKKFIENINYLPSVKKNIENIYSAEANASKKKFWLR